MEGGRAPAIVVVALGAGALGGPDALRALLTLAGQSPVMDIAICLLVIGMCAAHVLGVLLLARFVRKPCRARRRAPPADCLFARMTLSVAVGAAFSVAACLVAVPGGGLLLSSAGIAFEFAGKSSTVVVAAGFLLLLCITPLLRVLRAAAHATEARKVCLAVTCLLLVSHFAATGGFDALRHSSAASVNKFIGVSTFAVAGTILLIRRVAYAAPAPATGTARFFVRLMKVTSPAAVCFTLAYFLLLIGEPGRKSNGGKHTCAV